MARSRIALTGASGLLVLAATLGGAEAQTGAPLPLLQIDHSTATVHAHHKAAVRIARARSAEKPVHRHIAKRVHARTRVADAERDLPAPPQSTPSQAAPAPTTPPQAALQNDPQNIWPASAAAAPGNVEAPGASPAGNGMAALSPAPAAAGVTTEQVVDTSPNGILNGSHTVPAAMPAAATPAASAPQPAAAKPAAPVKVASAAPKAGVHAMLFRPSTPLAVGSASWIAQLLVALGGAIAAGAIAWLLIRPKPERTYG
jgi:hypothetical protein